MIVHDHQRQRVRSVIEGCLRGGNTPRAIVVWLTKLVDEASSGDDDGPAPDVQAPPDAQGALRARLDRCQERLEHFRRDAEVRLEMGDMHGVRDAAADADIEQSRIDLLLWVLGESDG